MLSASAVNAFAAEDGAGQELLPGALQFGVGDRLVGQLGQFGQHQLFRLGFIFPVEQFQVDLEPAGIAAGVVVAGADGSGDLRTLDQLLVQPAGRGR